MIQQRYDELSGLFVIQVYIEGIWYTVSQQCEEDEAEHTVNLLRLWRDQGWK